jgi:glycosyltransferase involved in cell wall biosynthesis
MGVYNGAAHLREQLDSFAAQDHADWRLVASDDGSTDDSRAVVAGFAAERPRGQVQLADGPGRGHAANYLAMLRSLPEAPGWLAFSDQDDVWLPDRLSRGLRALSALPPDVPAIFCSRSFITAPDLTGRRLSAARLRPPSFRNALVQNIAAGNTMLLNPAGSALLARAARRCPGFVVHDWWAYLLITGAGGTVVHDDRPTILYRQHTANAIGANDSGLAKARRLLQVVAGTFRDWNDVNAAALEAARGVLEPEARAVFDAWQAMRRHRGVAGRLRRLRALQLYRQSRASTLALWFAALIGRL